jgi:signal transduction histidine kinase/CheY-like chemotaxis protein
VSDYGDDGNSDAPRPPAAFLIADPAGLCAQVSPGWAALSGLDAARNLGDGWLDLAHPDDRERLRSKWRACVSGQGDLAVPIRLRVSGEAMSLCATRMPLGFIVVLQEAAAERSDAELLQARKMEAVGRLASGLAHDFANLLTLISGYSEILLGRLEPHDISRPELDEIRKAANRGSGLTSQLLAFCRRHAIEPQVLDLNALVLDMGNMLRRMIGEHIELATQLGAGLESVKADPGQMGQVIMNLAINARDAMPGGGRIDIRTENVDLGPEHAQDQPGARPRRYVMLQVSDTGHGMDAGTLDRIFEPFFTTKALGRGYGLGLATVQSIVKQGSGDISVQSAVGLGTTFTIHLPVVSGAGPAETVEATLRPTTQGNETILLVEDEEGVRRLLKHVLAREGYNVLEAASGPEALELYHQLRDPVDLLLTDVVMPRMSGRELADQILKLQPGLKIVFISGYADEAMAGTGNLAALFLAKPLRPAIVAEGVRAVLDGVRVESASGD